MTKNKIDIEVEKTIGLVREIKRADSDPLLYDKVIERIGDPGNEGNYRQGSIKVKFGYALITVFIIFNFIASLYVFNQAESIEDDSAYQEFSQDLNINGNEDIYSQL